MICRAAAYDLFDYQFCLDRFVAGIEVRGIDHLILLVVPPVYPCVAEDLVRHKPPLSIEVSLFDEVAPGIISLRGSCKALPGDGRLARSIKIPDLGNIAPRIVGPADLHNRTLLVQRSRLSLGIE